MPENEIDITIEPHQSSINVIPTTQQSNIDVGISTVFDVEWGRIAGNINNQTDLISSLNAKADTTAVDTLETAINGKQDNLVSGTNIKTVNGNSILGSGNLTIDSLPNQSGNNGKFLTTDGTSASWKPVSVRNIGEIVQSTIPLTDSGLHLLDGALLSGSGTYASFVTYISGLVSDYPDLFETEANWQSSVTTYGVCGKFVYDPVNNTVRLPKITGFVEGTITPTTLGDLTEAGLPNITGDGLWWENTQTGDQVQGAFYINYSTHNNKGSSSTDNDNYSISMDASLSNPKYGNSNTVQPQSIKVLFYIVIATTTKTDIQVDIDQIATDLNGKADVDLSNCIKPHVIETYSSGASWYRIWSDGWIEQGGVSSSVSGEATTSISFLENMEDTNYTISITPIGSYTAQSEANDCVSSISTSGMVISSGHYASQYFSWKVEGKKGADI